MLFQFIFSVIKKISTIFTLETLLKIHVPILVYGFLMPLQVIFGGKCLPTIVTLKISFLVVNCVQMNLQISWLVERFSTDLTSTCLFQRNYHSHIDKNLKVAFNFLIAKWAKLDILYNFFRYFWLVKYGKCKLDSKVSSYQMFNEISTFTCL